MIDVITYSQDVTKIIPEVEELFPQYVSVDENGKKSLIATLTPVVYNGYSSLSLVRCEQQMYDDLSTLTSLEILGSYDEIFADSVKDDKYKSVYPYDVPIEYVDEDGLIQTYMRPKKIGAFA